MLVADHRNDGSALFENLMLRIEQHLPRTRKVLAVAQN